MATAELIAEINAKDNASAVINGVTKNLSGMQSQLKEMEPAFKTMAVVGTAAFAAISAEIYTSIKAAGEHQNAEAQLNAVLKSTGAISGATSESINELALSLNKTTGYSDDTIISINNLLIGFTNINSDTLPKATQAILDFATRTGTDAVSASNLLGRALQDPILGMTTLRREGLVLSDQQKQMVTDFQNGGEMAKAQGIIIDALNTKYGGASTQTDTLAFKERALSSAIEQLQQTIGKGLMPALNNLFGGLTPVINKITEWVQQSPGTVTAITGIGLALSGLAAAFGIAGIAATHFAVAAWAAVAPLLALVGPLLAVTAAAGLAAGMISDKLNSTYVESTNASEEYATKIGQLADRLKTLQEPIQADSDKMKQFATDMATANQKIQDLNDQINKTTEDWNNQAQDINKRRAEAIVAQEQNVADIKQQLQDAEAQKDTASNEKSIEDLKIKLSKETTALNSANQEKSMLSADYAEAKRRAAETDFQRKMEDLDKEAAADGKAYLAKLATLRKEVADAQKAKNDLVAQEVAYTKSIQVQEAQRLKDVVDTTAAIKASMAERAMVTSSNNKPYQSGGSILGAIGTGIANVLGINNVHDAVITPQGVVHTDPEDYLIATKTPGSLGGGRDININISGAVLSEDAARIMGDLIVGQLRLQLKF